MSTVAFITLGCKVNQFETESMEGLFKQSGYDIVPSTNAADVYVINTCSVTSFGDKKSRQLIRRVQRLNPKAVIAVTGCYSQAAPDEVKAIEGVRVVLGTSDRANIVNYVEQAMEEDGVIDKVDDIMKAREFEDIPLYEMPARTRAFLKIQEGCTNFCSYCIIPYTRGPLRSRKLESIRSEAQKLLDHGFKEIVLTGIHLGAYGKDFKDGTSLYDAAKAVLELPGLRRLRLSSLESIELSPELLELIKTNPKFSHHLHLPLQAGSDEVLKKMNRHYNRDEFTALIKNVKKSVPGVAISTDVIVGFPGETEEMFAESLEYIKTLGFARMHVFPYSPRTGTPAAKLPDQVPEPVKKERVHRLQSLAQEMADDFHSQYLGTVQEVLFETNNDGITDGLTDTYIRVYTDDEVKTGELYKVRLEKLYKDGVYGKLTGHI
ncbi:tRNA (N(6)-L-threonylcarbamoyladenosine(37)-C(2))-methylthiotransferase MtaB [Anaerovibrio lipolyticus]|uniref:tRNA (N(6)-L-threonylcarbamoyladenosine(37)-C(2))- methylthiotransferase MtaB n=1 Tax=Anaerovibrio lipolyticus TaxID=82374 RepID=UPI0026EA0F5B|nr:tRNA (N(6)-L-threonylcarbamoyladenosine(37)-C(2))-methylthiotransferase MtaB [Anaerovibrio lipolyticus]MBE6105080.1 tRNA (N(6)-L-threonylcarbamoyladenosine(37)-C(2))-methylthiotransferase MtaB [Anaerovibrio lipolyticus]